MVITAGERIPLLGSVSVGKWRKNIIIKKEQENVSRYLLLPAFFLLFLHEKEERYGKII